MLEKLKKKSNKRNNEDLLTPIIIVNINNGKEKMKS